MSQPHEQHNQERLHCRIDELNGRIHTLRSMLRDAGFPDRIKMGEDLHGNEDWVLVRVNAQLKDCIEELNKLRSSPDRAVIREAVEALETANEMHLGRCASSEPFSATDYRNHACDAREYVRTALTNLQALLANDGEEESADFVRGLEAAIKIAVGTTTGSGCYGDAHTVAGNIRAEINRLRAPNQGRKVT